MPRKDPQARREYNADYQQRPEVALRRQQFYSRRDIKDRQAAYYREYRRLGRPPGQGQEGSPPL